ncbi:zinc transporter ZIP5 [Neodiprion pinetum]|uniref:zinc transporter ZIP5 n=1 Tax=Neodiprion pinetum TaxID=441929 RepID=UPI001EE09DC4|nr:zinc transporter ZIP6 [Neodiprion pinetum]
MAKRYEFCGCWFVVMSFAVCYTCGSGNKIIPNQAHRDHRFFLQQIFDKYGDKGIITFEGFEHLLENLGLGRLSFEKNHNVSAHRINGSFQEMHDALQLHDHRHGAQEFSEFYADDDASYQDNGHFAKADEVFAKADDFSTSERNFGQSTTKFTKRNLAEEISGERVEQYEDSLCLSPQALLQTFGLRPNHSVAIKPPRFLHLCPAIIYQLDRRACDVRVNSTLSIKVGFSKKVSRTEAWIHATLATGVISSVGLLAVTMVKLTRRPSFLHFLVALAVGTLSGDALLHLLPHALLSEDMDHETAALRCSATFLAVVFFYALEATLFLVRSPKLRKKEAPGDEPDVSFELGASSAANKSVEEAGSMLTQHGHSHGLPEGKSSSLVLLILVGDGLHNMADGLAIGASFASDPVAGLATTIAVFCHELPHELGDFAVLINTGMSVRRALMYNLLSSALSFVGAAVGVCLGEIGNASHWIYAVTAGSFMYIALANLVPEMMSFVKTDAKAHGILIQLSGIALGGMLMLLIALHEEKLMGLLS